MHITNDTFLQIEINLKKSGVHVYTHDLCINANSATKWLLSFVVRFMHLIPKWRIIVTWPSMPRFCAALPRSSRATSILEFILFTHFIYFATYKLQCVKRKQIMTSIQDSDTLKLLGITWISLGMISVETRHRGPGNNYPPFWNKVYRLTVTEASSILTVAIEKSNKYQALKLSFLQCNPDFMIVDLTIFPI